MRKGWSWGRHGLGSLAALLGLACTAQRVEVATPEPPPAETLAGLQERYLPRIEDNNATVAWYEARKQKIVDDRVHELERLRRQHENLLSQVEAKRKAVALLGEDAEDRRQRLAELEGEARPTPSVASKIGDLRDQIAALERKIAAETAELERLRAEAETARAEVERFAALNEEQIFLSEMQPYYREGIDLHLEFYRGLIAIAEQRLPESSDAVALIDHFQTRIGTLTEMRDRPIAPEAFAAVRHELELDRRISQAWLSAYILELRFALSRYRLDDVGDQERQELALVAEALKERWAEDTSLVLFIDGHADSKKFKGESDCGSATRNKDLSRQRAEVVRDFFFEQLNGSPDRIFVDWFGNFSMQVDPQRTGEKENRRIELRITSMNGQSFGSHRDYFAMRHGLDLAGIRFLRQPGEWVDQRCREEPVAESVEYLSSRYRKLVAALGLEAAATVPLGVDGRQLSVRLGNDFVAMSEGRCVRVRPCSAGR